ncbi:type II toxin-antitoxin system toxin DNA ADP-ribosyl transferase DarT [Streptomyces chumphonensis]|uniref:type II toxin-antitoxin system toxin DNA ADP-ribosyl transferase DarT n=1 Tax=Streptomyces chumphonensis TaxID=1214925 RepID=UPI003D711FFE
MEAFDVNLSRLRFISSCNGAELDGASGYLRPVLPPEDRPVLHFTHLRNLPGILDRGFLMCDRFVRADGILQVECADHEIKARRRSRKVDVPPGGVVADYVPFYFAPRSPMLYKINKGAVSTYADGQDPLVYLVSTPRRLLGAGCPSVFSDGNCAADISVLENEPGRLADHVDWAVMRQARWNNTGDDPDRMRRRMAEFLVHERVPVSAFAELAVRTPARAREVRRLLPHGLRRLPVAVRPSWYY